MTDPELRSWPRLHFLSRGGDAAFGFDDPFPEGLRSRGAEIVPAA